MILNRDLLWHNTCNSVHNMKYLAILKNKILFEEGFHGMEIPFNWNNGSKGCIYFPIQREKTSELQNPITDYKPGFEFGDWGNIFPSAKDKEGKEYPPTMLVGGIVIEFDESNYFKVNSDFIRSFTNNLISKICIVNPLAASNRNTADASNYVAHIVRLDDAFAMDEVINQFTNSIYPITLKQWELICDNINNSPTIQYDLMHKAFNYNIDNDYRNELLCYATIVDITLKQILQKKIESEDFEKEAKDSIKKCSGYQDFLKNMALLKIPIYRSEKIDSLMSMRNKVIHEGVYKGNPITGEHLNGYYFEMLKFLEEYHVNYFEEIK